MSDNWIFTVWIPLLNNFTHFQHEIQSYIPLKVHMCIWLCQVHCRCTLGLESALLWLWLLNVGFFPTQACLPQIPHRKISIVATLRREITVEPNLKLIMWWFMSSSVKTTLTKCVKSSNFHMLFSTWIYPLVIFYTVIVVTFELPYSS